MRENKLRVWDEEAEIFVYSSEEDENYFWLFENGRLQVMRRTSEFEYVEGIAVAEYPSAEEIDSELEQYSGFKDSKDVEIYEENIVRVTLSSGRKIKAVIKFTDGCFEIQAKDPEFRTRSEYHSKRDYLKCYTVNHAVEVIGSIRENPELLEG